MNCSRYFSHFESSLGCLTPKPPMPSLIADWGKEDGVTIFFAGFSLVCLVVANVKINQVQRIYRQSKIVSYLVDDYQFQAKILRRNHRTVVITYLEGFIAGTAGLVAGWFAIGSFRP